MTLHALRTQAPSGGDGEPALDQPAPSVSAANAPRPRLVTVGGASASLEQRPTGEVLCVRDGHDAILFEYDAAAGTGTLRMPAGDLRLEAPHGNIQLLAGKGVQCTAAGPVALCSATAASVTVRTPGAGTSGLHLSGDHATLASDHLAVGARRAELQLAETRLYGRTFEVGLERAAVVLDKLESTIETAIEHLGNAFCTVKELYQIRAGRQRTVVEGGIRTEAGHVVMRARQDVLIDGERINLG